MTKREEELIPRYMRHGALRLDILKRAAAVGDQALPMFQKEFDLLWFLLANRGDRFDKFDLLDLVWEVRRDLETDRVRVHIARLRSILKPCGLYGLIKTDDQTRYYIEPE